MNQPMHTLQKQVQDALAEINEMRGARIDVLDSNGVVTLTGIAPSAEARDQAEAIVRGTPGVISVINELHVV